MKIARGPLFEKLVVPLFIISPLFWLTLRFVQACVSKEVIENIEKSDLVIRVGLHEDFGVSFLVDKKSTQSYER